MANPCSSARRASGRRRWPWSRREGGFNGDRVEALAVVAVGWARPPKPRATAGHSPLSQQSSSIWWIFISANSPPETQKKLVKLRICHNSSSCLPASCPALRRPDGPGKRGPAGCRPTPSRIRLMSSWRFTLWRHCRPAAILRFFFWPPRRLQHAPQAGGVGGERFLHEHVHAFLHGVFELQGTDVGKAGQHGHVVGTQAVDGLLVGVEADELPFLGHVHPVAETNGQGFVPASAGPRPRRPWHRAGPGHGWNSWRCRPHRFRARRSRSGQANGVVLGSVDPRNGHVGQAGGRGSRRAPLLNWRRRGPRR